MSKKLFPNPDWQERDQNPFLTKERDLPQTTYVAAVRCCNCGVHTNLAIPFGKPVHETPCEDCGCTMLTTRHK